MELTKEELNVIIACLSNATIKGGDGQFFGKLINKVKIMAEQPETEVKPEVEEKSEAKTEDK